MAPPRGKGKFSKDRKPKRNQQSLLFRRKRFCRFTVTGVTEIDYKDDLQGDAEDVGEIALQGGVKIPRRKHSRQQADGDADQPAANQIKHNRADDLHSDSGDHRDRRFYPSLWVHSPFPFRILFPLISENQTASPWRGQQILRPIPQFVRRTVRRRQPPLAAARARGLRVGSATLVRVLRSMWWNGCSCPRTFSTASST